VFPRNGSVSCGGVDDLRVDKEMEEVWTSGTMGPQDRGVYLRLSLYPPAISEGNAWRWGSQEKITGIQRSD
jgi:hypothetical protein